METAKQQRKDVIAVAIKVMKDVEWRHDQAKSYDAVFTSLEEQYEKYGSAEGFEEKKHLLYAFWSVFFDFPQDEEWNGRNMMWVRIYDETGQAYEVGHRQWKGKLSKNGDRYVIPEN